MNNAMLLYAHLTDKELVDRIKAGQRGSFEVLVRRHSQALYRVARMYSFSHNEAEDLIGCTFLEAFSTLQDFRNPVSFRTWLTRLMIVNCMNAKKKVAGKHEEPHEPACAATRSAHHYDSERLLLSYEVTGQLETCIEQLSVPLRSVFILTEIDGYSLSETAHLLSTSEEFVKVRLVRAKSSLRKSLRRWYRYSDIYPFDLHACERVVRAIMDGIDEKSDVPAGAPTF